MASELKVNKITPESNTTVTLGDPGDTIVLAGTVDGANITNVNASNLASGTVDNARLDAQLQDVAGLATTSGSFIQGNGSNFTLSAYTLPTADGTADQVLTTDGLGSVTFADAGGGGGSTISAEAFTAYFDTGTTTVGAPGPESAATVNNRAALIALMDASANNTWLLTRFDYIVLTNYSGDSSSFRFQIRKGYRTFT